MKLPKLILASASPRRRLFLEALDLPHRVQTAHVDETRRAGESPPALVERLAVAKATTVAQRTPADQRPCLVIGADTVVALDGPALGERVLGKPADAAEAFAMLQDLRTRPHKVYSGVAVVRVEPSGQMRSRSRVNVTTVIMRAYGDDEIARYVASRDPLDKAGGYAIQHRNFAPVQALEGCAAGVMGLPLADLVDLLADFGVHVQIHVPTVCERLTGMPCCQSRVEDEGSG